MDLSEQTDVLSNKTFRSVLADSPFADRAERIRNTLRAVHHQYLQQKLTGQYFGPEVDYASLEEVAYYLSGVATTPGRADGIPLSLRSQMLAVSALVFEYLGDIASSQLETGSSLEESHLYYLDACICNTLGLFEANTIALARKHLLQQDKLDSALNTPDPPVGRDVCQSILYAWLAREMPFLWVRRRRVDLMIKNTISDLNAKLADGLVSRYIYGEMRYWLALAEGVTLHARFFQFGKDNYLGSADEKFSYAIEQAKRLNNPPLLWIAYAIQKCAESMGSNSVWKRLTGVCPSRYLRRLVTSSPPVLELWASQISALEATAHHPITDEPIDLDHGFLDPKIRRLVIGMPTSAGKTLLAELSIVRTLFPDVESQKPVPNTTCIYVVPSLALVNQIEAKLLTRLLPMGIRVTAILGGYDVAQLDDMLLTQTRVAVVTPEKLDMLVRQDHTFVQNCGLFVFDEIHKVDSLARGWTMEAIITWLKDFHPQAKKARMIFMSAVMPNYLQIQMWVQDQDAPVGSVPVVSISEPWQPTRQIKGFLEIDENDIIEKTEKPPLTEYWYGGHLNYVSDRSDLAQPLQIRRLIRTKETFRRRIRRKTKEAYTERESKSSFGVEENAAEIAKRYTKANLDPVLVFFVSRGQTRSFCEYLASSEDYSPAGLTGREQTQYGLFLNYLEDRLGDKHPLAEFAAKGIAYHHGWLPRDVRAEIEYAFSNRWIRVLASTTTLIEGVNFPISTFVLANYEQVIGSQGRKPIFWLLEKKDFQNMIGRSGRAVYDTEGQIVFMVPSRPKKRGVTWQDYLFASPDDPERLILSSLNREDFRRSILELILNAMEHPALAESALSIDPELLNSDYGPGAREVGETILRLQAFLLALMDKEVLDPENIETVFRFFRRTLFGQQQEDDALLELVTRFTQKTGQLMITAESDEKRRAVYGKIGLGFTSCELLYQKASDFWTDYGKQMFDKEVEHITADFLDDICDFAFSLVEVRPGSVKIPHTRPARYLTIPHGEVIGRWIVTLSSLMDIRDDYFKEIPELGERTEACANYIRDAFEYKAPWILSAFCLFVSNVAQTEGGVEEFENTPLGRQLSILPAYSKFGVNNPASAFFSMIGVRIRDMAALLGKYYSQENPDRYFEFSLMFGWVLELEPEQVAEWFKNEYGEDNAGQVSRLFRLLDSLRRREQSLVEILPLEIAIAGWQYYQGARVLPRMIVGEEVMLRPDPLNPWDAYAVEVFNRQGTKLGFIPKGFSQAVYNHLTNEIPLKATITNIDREAEYHPVRIMLDAPED